MLWTAKNTYRKLKYTEIVILTSYVNVALHKDFDWGTFYFLSYCRNPFLLSTILGARVTQVKNKITNHSINQVKKMRCCRRAISKQHVKVSRLCDILRASYSAKCTTQNWFSMGAPCWCTLLKYTNIAVGFLLFPCLQTFTSTLLLSFWLFRPQSLFSCKWHHM